MFLSERLRYASRRKSVVRPDGARRRAILTAAFHYKTGSL